MCLATAYKEKEEPNSILLEYVAENTIEKTSTAPPKKQEARKIFLERAEMIIPWSAS